MDAEIIAYGAEVDRRLRQVLGDRLLGTWFVGSVALDDVRPGASDVDIAAVVAGELRPGEGERIAAAVSHAVLPCPARQLELVGYPAQGVGPDGGPDEAVPLFDLGTGEGQADRLALAGSLPPGFWFVIDRVVAHRSGLTIAGPPAAEVFAEPDRRDVLEAMLESVRWHRSSAGVEHDAVLNGARGWRFAATGVLGSKRAGAAWARSHTAHAEVLAAAVDGPDQVVAQHHEADAFLDEVERALRDALT